MASKRKALRVDEKAAILWRLEAGEKNSVLAKELGIPHNTISTIWKNREKVKEAFEQKPLGIKKLKETKHMDIERSLLQWFRDQRSNNVPISGPVLLEKANEFAIALGKDFTCSASWIQRFRSRHNIVFGKISGESASVDSAIPQDWLKSVWPKLCETYTDDEIFNCDETALFYRMMPNRTLRFKGEKCFGGKMSKERLTVLLATNLNGSEKRKLVIIGKSAKPRCFKNINSLPVDFESNAKAWMTSVLFEKILRKWDSELYRRKKKILLLLDNCAAHPNLNDLRCIKLAFLPPNTTSILQPLDQGIIRTLKHNFRKLQVMRMIRDLEENQTFKLNVLDAVTMVAKAWDQVSCNTIRNCFGHAGFLARNEVDFDASFSSEDEIPLARLARQVAVDLPDNDDMQNIRDTLDMTVTWEEFISVDDDLITTEQLTTEKILEEAEENCTDFNELIEDSDHDDIEVPTISQALTSVWNLRRFALFNEHLFSSTAIKSLATMEEEIEKTFLTTKCKKQTKITDFFSDGI